MIKKERYLVSVVAIELRCPNGREKLSFLGAKSATLRIICTAAGASLAPSRHALAGCLPGGSSGSFPGVLPCFDFVAWRQGG